MTAATTTIITATTTWTWATSSRATSACCLSNSGNERNSKEQQQQQVFENRVANNAAAKQSTTQATMIRSFYSPLFVRCGSPLRFAFFSLFALHHLLWIFAFSAHTIPLGPIIRVCLRGILSVTNAPKIVYETRIDCESLCDEYACRQLLGNVKCSNECFVFVVVVLKIMFSIFELCHIKRLLWCSRESKTIKVIKALNALNM